MSTGGKHASNSRCEMSRVDGDRDMRGDGDRDITALVVSSVSSVSSCDRHNACMAGL